MKKKQFKKFNFKFERIKVHDVESKMKNSYADSVILMRTVILMQDSINALSFSWLFLRVPEAIFYVTFKLSYVFGKEKHYIYKYEYKCVDIDRWLM